MSTPDPTRIDRRLAIKWIMAAGAGAVLLRGHPLLAGSASPPAVPGTSGYGTDPNLTKPYKQGDYWPLTFSNAQRQAAVVLSDIIIPPDADSPSASAVGVPDFVDEWVSAPYEGNVQDRKVITEGLLWLDGETGKRFGAPFPEASAGQREQLCAEMAAEAPEGTPAGEASRFFRRFRDLVAVGYYTTPPGMKAIGYVGNVPLATFDGPPAELIAKLGLSDEVKS